MARSQGSWVLVAENVIGVVIGAVLLGMLFSWVLVDTFQSVDLPTTPRGVRIAVMVALYFVIAGALGFVRPAGSWRWGVRLAIPTIVVLGIVVLLDWGGSESRDSLRWLVGVLGVGTLGGWLGGRVRHQPGSVAS